ncbi:hypothetical protein DE146DRAFT_514951 [Phaeosphaeria sp. MPI-PUGE-AT-0046c]|nr:hypothetical protein DE146DRAFT_514951 [Phaeosphaeria sp. MPI-PUGE-AT-0046c]
MKSFAVLALAATAALAQTAPPSGCSASRAGSFNIQTVNITRSSTKRELEARQLAGTLTLTLQNGILRDQAGRQGYIASNYQLQYDSPLQAGARESSGFSVCSNGSLALSAAGRAAPAVWYQCLSGTFYNLYSQSIGAQCVPIYMVAVAASGGQPQPTQPPRVSQLSDGQPQASSPRPVVSQISDGQPQAASPRPVVSTPRPVVVSQISDGQPQAASPRPVVSTPRPAVVSQISDGQPQAPPAATPRPVVSQISDGQPQAPAPRPVVSTPRPVVSQIADGQPQAPAGNVSRPTASSPPAQYTGAAASSNAAAGAFVAGLFGLFAML